MIDFGIITVILNNNYSKGFPQYIFIFKLNIFEYNSNSN